MSVRGTVLELPESLNDTWRHGLEVRGATLNFALESLSARRGDASVAIYPIILRTGPNALAVQYKEFWRKRPDCERLKEDVVGVLLELGAKTYEMSPKPSA